ncbi:MAG: clostripain-related cysteine peptidase [Anaerolineae bacterium]
MSKKNRQDVVDQRPLMATFAGINEQQSFGVQPLFAGDDGKRTVRTQRRRRSDQSSGKRDRAQAPQRRKTEPPRSSGGGSRPPSRPRPTTGGQLPGGGIKLPPAAIVVLVIVGLCLYLAMNLFGGDDAGDTASFNPPAAAPVDDSVTDESKPLPTLPAAEFIPPPASTEGQTWLVMLYQDADDKILEQDIYLDLNEAERIGSNDRVQIVAQVDRFAGGYQGDGDWTDARRYYITQNDDLGRLSSQPVVDLGEVNMSDGNTLVDFVTWAYETFPADKYVLIMSDHGMGWPGGWSDPAPGGRSDSSIPLVSRLGDELYLMEIDEALGEIQAQTGLEQFELIGMDACLMGHLEVFSALAPHARYAVASQEVEPALGWAYALTAVDLAALPNLMNSVNNLAYTLQSGDQRTVAQARTYAQSFTSVFGSNIPPSYIDLGNFSALLQQQSGSGDVSSAANQVLTALNQTIIAEKHGPDKPGATGVSIYFPNSQLYGNPITGPESYTAVANRFAQDSLWDDFLAYHYTGRSFEPAAAAPVIPERGISAPAAGITVSPVTASTDTVALGESVLLSSDISSGENVGYVYLSVGYYDPAANSVLLADSDYLESADTRQIDGVYYPDWGAGEFTMEFEWEPIVYALSDGTNTVTALLTPQTYGAAYEEATYTTDGIYTYGDSGETRHARLLFQDGILRQVLGFTGEDGTGAPREIIPQTGDSFTVLEKWQDLDGNGRVTQTAFQEGGTLTFGDQMFTWEELDAAPGPYLVGFIVSDLDGNTNEVYQPITVE